MAQQTPVQVFRHQEKMGRFTSPSFYLKIAILAAFVITPFVFPSFKSVDLAFKFMIFAVLVASFDILLGYTGILSFGHVMFFGIGAYSVALLLGKYAEPTYGFLFLGFVIAVIVSTALALLISFLSLRVQAIFFAMVTLAIAEFAIILATKLSSFTGGEDGLIMSTPGIFKTSFDVGSFMYNMMGLYFSSGGKQLNTGLCNSDDSCPHIKAITAKLPKVRDASTLK